MSRDKTYFLSDLHLGAPYFDDSHAAERRIVSFLDSIKHEAKAICFLGDILDYWYEYRYVVPKGFVRFFGKLAELSDSGVQILWLIGNHDIWMFDYLPSEIGVKVADGPLIYECDGKNYLLAHGDGLGKTPFSFKIMRSLFRNRFCQWLYAGIHPRWTIPFAQNWSRSSRTEGMKVHQERLSNSISNLRKYAEEYSLKHPYIDAFIFGHLHVAYQKPLPTGKPMIILGDWISNFTYAVTSPEENLSLHKIPTSMLDIK